MGDLLEARFELFLGRQVEILSGGEDGGVFRQVQFDVSVVLAVVKNDADGGNSSGSFTCRSKWHLGLVAAERQAFVEGTADLAQEFADAQRVGGGFDFVERVFFGAIDGEQLDVVGPAGLDDLAEVSEDFPIWQRRPFDLRGSPDGVSDFQGASGIERRDAVSGISERRPSMWRSPEGSAVGVGST